MALLLVLEAQHGVHHGWSYAFMPIALLTLVLMLLAMAMTAAVNCFDVEPIRKTVVGPRVCWNSRFAMPYPRA